MDQNTISWLKSSWTLHGRCWCKVDRLLHVYVMKHFLKSRTLMPSNQRWAVHLPQPLPLSGSLWTSIFENDDDRESSFTGVYNHPHTAIFSAPPHSQTSQHLPSAPCSHFTMVLAHFNFHYGRRSFNTTLFFFFYYSFYNQFMIISVLLTVALLVTFCCYCVCPCIMCANVRLVLLFKA